MDAWQKFLSVYDLVMAWCQSKTNYLEEPITLSSLEVVKQKAHEFSVLKQFIYCCVGTEYQLYDLL